MTFVIYNTYNWVALFDSNIQLSVNSNEHLNINQKLNNKNMFVKAIEEIQQFTRPVHTIVRHYHNDFIHPGAATLFFVNEEGVAITCKHVLDILLQEPIVNRNYEKFKAEKLLLGTKIDGKYKKKLKELETKYNYNQTDSVAQLNNLVIGCLDKLEFDWFAHPTLDLAILKFKNFKEKHYTSYAIFIKDSSQIKPGKSLCRFGYPFVEFTNFEYDKINDEIKFTTTGNQNALPFPIDGIITRQVSNDGKTIDGIEMSTPGLRGQSGGPLFDVNGLVYGLQSVTNFFHLGFNEQKIEIITKGKKTHILNETFFNAGRCVHVNSIKEFLKANNVKFYEE